MPSGKAGYKKGQVEFTYKDNKITKDSPEFIEYIEEHHKTYIQTTKTVAWGEMKKGLKIDGDKVISEYGEILDIKAKQGEDKFYVKTNL